MKKRLAIAVVLALLMLLAMVVPTFAAAPRGAAGIMQEGADSGGGVIQIARNPDNTIDVTIRLGGAEPNSSYVVNLYWPSIGGSSSYLGFLDTNDHGNGYMTWTSASPYGGSRSFQLSVGQPYAPDYISGLVYITFPPLT